MYNENLVSWLHSEIKEMASMGIDKTKINNEDRYFQLFEAKYAKVVKDYDFSQITLPKELLELTPEQQLSMKEFVDLFCPDNSDYERYLKLVCHVGYCFEKANLNETPEYKAILANYSYLKTLWDNRYPLEYQKFQLEKQRGFRETSQPTQPTRPNCIECGSYDVYSREPNWCCKSCGRQWLKHPRRKNLNLHR
jgi:hypothetical protein